MAKDSDGEALGNKDPHRRGRGPKDAIGQKIPDKVRKEIEPKDKK